MIAIVSDSSAPDVAVDRYPGRVTDASLDALVAALGDARNQAEVIVGTAPAGVRAVEPARGRRWYLCAFDGPRFLCLDADFEVEQDRRRVRQAATCVLLVEHAESLLEQGEVDILAAAASALAAHVEAVDLRDALGALQAAAQELASWCAASERAVASLPQIEVATRLHDLARRQYERYVEGTEPLVAIQDRLADELVTSLRDLEEAAGRAGISRPLASAIAEAMQALDTGAAEMVAKHITPLEGEEEPVQK